jgi:hypothetical protein
VKPQARRTPSEKAALSALRRGIVVWFVLIGVEFLHGIARAIWLVPVVGDFRARQVGVFTGIILNLTVAALFIRWVHPTRIADAVKIGGIWLVLTVAFEITFGRVVMQASWQRIGSDYDLAHAGLLPIGLVQLALAPLITAKVRRVL